MIEYAFCATLLVSGIDFFGPYPFKYSAFSRQKNYSENKFSASTAETHEQTWAATTDTKPAGDETERRHHSQLGPDHRS